MDGAILPAFHMPFQLELFSIVLYCQLEIVCSEAAVLYKGIKSCLHAHNIRVLMDQTTCRLGQDTFILERRNGHIGAVGMISSCFK